jgi:hypothetical protein
MAGTRAFGAFRTLLYYTMIAQERLRERFSFVKEKLQFRMQNAPHNHRANGRLERV